MKLALGTVQFGLDYGLANQTGQVQNFQINKILSEAKGSGIDLLDTAIGYGASEQVLGQAKVDAFKVVTKLPPLSEGQTNVDNWVKDQLKGSLARLGQKKLFGLLLHRPQDLFGFNGVQLQQALSDLKSNGQVEKIGVSIYSPYELDQILKRIQIDLIQAPLNVIDRRMETSGWLDRLKKDGVEIHTRSVFLQGLLLMDRSKVPEKFSNWSILWDKWHEKLRETGVSALEACLAYPLTLEQVDQVIVGVDSVKQLRDILVAMNSVNHELDTSFMVSTDKNLINPANWDHI